MALTDKLIAIGDAIRSKTGGTGKLTLDQMASEISNISTGLDDGKLALTTAVASDVLSGKTFYSGDKELKTGTLVTTASNSIWGDARIKSLSGFTVGKRYLISVVYDNGASISLSNCTVHAKGGNFWKSYGQDLYQFIVTANSSTIEISGNSNSNWSVATALALN